MNPALILLEICLVILLLVFLWPVAILWIAVRIVGLVFGTIGDIVDAFKEAKKDGGDKT